MKQTTIIISPRDRYTGLENCITNVYEHTDESLFDLIVLNLGYPKKIIRNAERLLANKSNASIIELGLMIPMEGIRNVRDKINTTYTVLLDNDSRVSENWLEPLLETANKGAALVSPLILEKAGVDEGAPLRNHVYTSEIRVVNVKDTPYLIEYKPYRRATIDEIPKQVTDTQIFELHCVLFNTKTLQAIELAQMTIREHIDIGMQLKERGDKMQADPRSIIYFDNLGTRASLGDLRYFNYRWNARITYDSSRLFEQRWGYNFYSESSIYNWAIRRRIFLLLRWLHVPIYLSNKLVALINKIKTKIKPVWDPLPDPIGDSKLYYQTIENGIPKQQTHEIFWAAKLS